MKHTILFNISLLGLIATICGCTGYCNPDYDGKEYLVLNVLAEAGAQVEASVTHTWYTGWKPRDVNVSDADVEVSVNGGPFSKMKYDGEKKKFVSEVVAEEGDEITVKAVSSEYGDAEGYSYVPNAVKIDSWSMDYFVEIDYNATIAGDGEFYHPKTIRFDYGITFTDPADEVNYYLLEVKGSSSDPIFGENDTPLDAIYSTNDEFMVFSDRSIEGKSYTLTCRLSSWDLFWDYEEFFVHHIRLYSISKDYYLYLLSIHKKYDGLNGSMEDLGIAEPRQIYTNVSSGAGIVGGQSVDMVENDVSVILEKILGIKPRNTGRSNEG